MSQATAASIADPEALSALGQLQWAMGTGAGFGRIEPIDSPRVKDLRVAWATKVARREATRAAVEAR